MNTQAKTQKYGQFIAMGGVAFALVGFLFVPFTTITYNGGQTQSSAYTYTAIQAAEIQGFIWLDALLACSILLVALLLAFSRNPFGMSRMSLEKQAQWGIYGLIGAGVVSLLVQFLVMQSIPASLVGMFSMGVSSSSLQTFQNSLSMSYASGSWFYVIGILVTIGGEVYALMGGRIQLAGQNTQAASPYGNPYPQNWQQPGQPPVYPPQDQYPVNQGWQPPQQPPTEYK